MSINTKQLRDLIIIPSLEEIDKYSDAAVNLLMGTPAQESDMGSYLAQYPTGPAMGIYQMEIDTHNDIHFNYLRHRPELKELVAKTGGSKAADMIWNLKYATVMCRIHYLRVPEALPDKDDIVGLAEYWKVHFNTIKGAGSIDEFIANYQRYVGKAAL